MQKRGTPPRLVHPQINYRVGLISWNVPLHARGYSKMTKLELAVTAVYLRQSRIDHDPSWKITFPWHVAVEEESDSGSLSTSALSVTGSSYSTTEWRWHLDRQALYLLAQGHAGEA